MKLIDVDMLKEWLKSIPLKDLSDGKGRVIMEDDFKRVIENMPEECIADAVPIPIINISRLRKIVSEASEKGQTMPNFCICKNYVKEGEYICPACMKKAPKPCITCRLPWTSEEQREIPKEQNEYGGG